MYVRFGALVLLAAFAGGAVAAPLNHAQVIASPEAAPADRLASARALLDDLDPTAMLGAFAPVLGPDAPDSETRSLLLRALSEHPAPPTDLVPHLHLGLQARDANPEWLSPLVRAAGSFHDRATALRLLELTDPASGVEDEAFAALERCTRRRDLGRDREAWSAWLDQASAMSEADWRAGVIDRLSRDAERAERERRALLDQLVGTARRLALAVEPGQRPSLIATLLLDAEPEVRRLGFELADRELAEARSLGKPVADAAIRLVADDEASVRARAAGLLNQLAPPESRHALSAALAQETDARAATAILQAVSRWPHAEMLQPIERWIGDPVSRSAASNAAWALHRAEPIADSTGWRLALALRSTPIDKLTPSMCKLLVTFGGAEERHIVTRMLGQPEKRRVAAEALATDAELYTTVVEAAEQDPALFAIALGAIRLHDTGMSAYTSIERLRTPDPEALDTALNEAASGLSWDDRMALARARSSDADSVARLLTVDPRPQSPEHAAMLAEAQLALGRPDRAVEAADSAPTTDTTTDDMRSRLDRVRVAGLLALGDLSRTDEATATLWLDEAERAGDAALSAAVAEMLERRDDLSDEERTRIAALLPEKTPEGP